MLQLIRDRAQRWLGMAVLILIAIPFAFWGVQEYVGSPDEAPVAKVNDEKIPRSQLDQAVQQQRQRMQQILGADYRGNLLDDEVIRKQALDQLVSEEASLQAARAAGFRVSDDQVAAQIRAIPAFQTNGRFDAARYEQQVRGLGYSARGFEVRIRDSLIPGQMYDGIALSAFVTPAEIDRLVELRGQQRDVEWVKIPVGPAVARQTVSDDEVRAAYESQRDRFMEPEQVRIEFVEISRAALAQQAPIDEAELRRRYDEHVERFRTEEQRRAAHILVQVEATADEKEVAAARARIEAAAARIAKGEAFERVAREVSEDSGSKEEGGDLGFFGRGLMDPDFEKAAFELGRGDVSKPVRTGFGFHLIKVLEIRSGQVKSFAEMRASLEGEARRQQADARYYEFAERAATLAYENPDSLEPVAQALGLKVMESGWFSRQKGEGVAADPALRAAAFAEDVLVRRNNSEPLESGGNRVVVLRVKEHREAAAKPLDSVRAEIVASVRLRKAAAEVAGLGEKLLADARAGAALEALARAQKLEFRKFGWIDRGESGLPRAAAAEAFRLIAANGAPALAGIALEDGSYAVIRVNGVRVDPALKITDAERLQIREALNRRRAEMEMDTLARAVRESAAVKLYDTGS